MTKEQVEANEKKMFEKYLAHVTKRYKGRLNYFEQNLEVCDTWKDLMTFFCISDAYDGCIIDF
jgi:hypothetical protein